MSDSKPKNSRRMFFPMFLHEAVLMAETARGKPGLRLSELGDLPDKQLSEIIPVVNPEYEISVDQGHVWARAKNAEDPVKLFPMDSDAVATFNHFNGQHTLGEIATSLAQAVDADADAAFAYAKQVFLALAKHLICLPKNPVDPLADSE